MNRTAALLPFLLLSLTWGVQAQSSSVIKSEGIGDSEASAKADANRKLELQIEVRVKILSAFSDIVQEYGQSMSYDPATDLVVVPTSSVGLAGIAYSLKPRKGYPDPFKVMASLDSAGIAPVYMQGLEAVRQEIASLFQAFSKASLPEDRKAIFDELKVFVNEYRAYRNLAVLFGLGNSFIPLSPVNMYELDSWKGRDNISADSFEEAGAKIAALITETPVYVAFDQKLENPNETEFARKIYASVLDAVAARGLKTVPNGDAARMALKLSYQALAGIDGSLSALEITGKTLSLKGENKGRLMATELFRLTPSQASWEY